MRRPRVNQVTSEGEDNGGGSEPEGSDPGDSSSSSSSEEDIMAMTQAERDRLDREMAAIKRQEDQRARQLKNVREGIKTLTDRLGTESGGVFDGKDPDKCLWFIAMFEEVLDLYQLGTTGDSCQLLEVDACSILTGCLGGTAQEVLRATKVTDKGLHRNLEKLKETIITKFMGDLTQTIRCPRTWEYRIPNMQYIG